METTKILHVEAKQSPAFCSSPDQVRFIRSLHHADLRGRRDIYVVQAQSIHEVVIHGIFVKVEADRHETGPGRRSCTRSSLSSAASSSAKSASIFILIGVVIGERRVD